jgi:hypothetical protein
MTELMSFKFIFCIYGKILYAALYYYYYYEQFALLYNYNYDNFIIPIIYMRIGINILLSTILMSH